MAMVLVSVSVGFSIIVLGCFRARPRIQMVESRPLKRHMKRSMIVYTL